MMVGRGVDDLLLQGEGGLETVFNDTLEILRRQDILAGNLEGAVTDRGRRLEKSYTFRFKPEVLSPLRLAGFDYFSLTNNHCYDFGEVGFTDTLVHLNEAGIATSGAGVNLTEALEPWKARVEELDIAFFSLGAYPPERNGFDGSKTAAAGEHKPGILWADGPAVAEIGNRISHDDFTVILVHGGREWTTEPTEYQKKLYRELVVSGADLILGSHPHVLQGVEILQGRLIAYSLGNFIFPGMDETRYGEESMILSVGVHNGEIRYVEFYPVAIDNRTVSLDKSGIILNRFLSRTRELTGDP
jgi:poly-gamma-glutamate synthesis protein (capsule biosynthesis protein)